MKRILGVAAAMALAIGCRGPSQVYDPFLGRTTVDPPGTATPPPGQPYYGAPPATAPTMRSPPAPLQRPCRVMDRRISAPLRPVARGCRPALPRTYRRPRRSRPPLPPAGPRRRRSRRFPIRLARRTIHPGPAAIRRPAPHQHPALRPWRRRLHRRVVSQSAGCFDVDKILAHAQH